MAKDCGGLDFGEEADWSTGESLILLFPITLHYSFLDSLMFFFVKNKPAVTVCSVTAQDPE